MPFRTPLVPDTFVFQDDGRIPNSPLPVLIFRNVAPFNDDTKSFLAAALEERFATNQWTGSWRNGVYSYHHFHSNTHEVLGVYGGSAILKLGGSHGHEVHVHAGDVIVLPAGVGHMCIEHTHDFGVVGAYPDGRECDLLTGEPGERPQSLENIKQVPVPKYDPVCGKDGGVPVLWAGVS